MQKASKARRPQAPISLNPIFNFDFIQTEESIRDRRSLSLPRIENKVLRETVACCFGKGQAKPKESQKPENYRRRDQESKQVRLCSLMSREQAIQNSIRRTRYAKSFQMNILRYMNIA